MSFQIKKDKLKNLVDKKDGHFQLKIVGVYEDLKELSIQTKIPIEALLEKFINFGYIEYNSNKDNRPGGSAHNPGFQKTVDRYPPR